MTCATTICAVLLLVTGAGSGPAPGRTAEPRAPDAVTISHALRSVPAIPSAESDAIVVGKVMAAEAVEVEDGSLVVTRLRIRVERLRRTGESARPPAMVWVERPGGSLHRRDGSVISVAADDGAVPEPGGRFMLFLQHGGTASEWTVLRAFELCGEDARSLDPAAPSVSASELFALAGFGN